MDVELSKLYQAQPFAGRQNRRRVAAKAMEVYQHDVDEELIDARVIRGSLG
jgi:hypothetical protein